MRHVSRQNQDAHHESFQHMPLDMLLRQLKTNPEKGLSQEDAEHRLQQYGLNVIEEKEESVFHRLARRFWGPIPWMLEGVILLSFFLRKWEDVILTTILLIVNGIVDFWQEHRALSALRVLKETLSPKARVLRDGVWQEIDAAQLVPGDIIRLRLGDRVPADARILSSTSLLADESMLTGESLPREHSPGDVLMANTIIKRGETVAVVIATGRNTVFGRTVHLVARAEREVHSRLQQLVIRIGDGLILLAAELILIMLLVELFRQTPLVKIIHFALVLLIASIPVALPTVLTLTLAIGALMLARQRVIVKRLAAIEALAGMNVLLSDKTGTLTKNELHVERILPVQVRREEDVIACALAVSREEDQDPLEKPLFIWAQERKLPSFHQKTFIPFNPDVKYSEAVVKYRGKIFIMRKGSPVKLLPLVKLSSRLRDRVSSFLNEAESKGMRVLAVIRRSVRDEAWRLVGIIALANPPRDDAREAIREAQELHIDMKMLTGDTRRVASFIAREVGLSGSILSAEAIRNGINVSRLKTVAGVAEVLPEDKYRVVSVYSGAGNVVGMMGDGVNDAPALQRADVGIAVENATDAARAAADLVLFKQGLPVILQGVRTARKIFQRMEAYVTYRIAETLRILFFMTLSILLLGLYPVTPLMIILLALLNDAPILAIAYDHMAGSEKPLRWKLDEIMILAVALGLTGVISSFLLLILVKDVWHLTLPIIQTIIFAKLVVAGHGTLYNLRVKDWFWRKPWPSRALFFATFGTRFLGTILAVYGFTLLAPIGWAWALFIWGYAMVWFLIAEVVKMLMLRLTRQGFFSHGILRLLHARLDQPL